MKLIKANKGVLITSPKHYRGTIFEIKKIESYCGHNSCYDCLGYYYLKSIKSKKEIQLCGTDIKSAYKIANNSIRRI